MSGRGDPRSRCSGARLCAAHRPRPPVAQRLRFSARACFRSLGHMIGATREGVWLRRGRDAAHRCIPAAKHCMPLQESIHDLHVRTIPRYIADLLVCFVVRSADWPEEMAPKRRMSEKKLQAWADTRLNRWHGCPRGSEVIGKRGSGSG